MAKCFDSELYFSVFLHSFDHHRVPTVYKTEGHGHSDCLHFVQSLFWSWLGLFQHAVHLLEFIHFLLRDTALWISQCNYKKWKVPKVKHYYAFNYHRISFKPFVNDAQQMFINIFFWANTLDVCSFICKKHEGLVKKNGNLVYEAIGSCFKKKHRHRRKVTSHHSFSLL